MHGKYRHLVYEEIIKNDILAKLNQLSRLKIEPTPTNSSQHIQKTKSKSKIKNFLYSLFYNFILTISIIILLFTKKNDSKSYDNSLIIHDPRLSKFSKNKNKVLFSGIHRISNKKHFHLYSLLSNSEIAGCIIFSLLNFNSAKKSIFNNSGISAVNKKTIVNLSGVGFFKVLDIILFTKSVEKLDCIQCAGHFDIYTSTASQLRKNNIIKKLCGFQHGLFEKFKYGEMQKLFFDEYTLQFEESEDYFSKEIASNKLCKIYIAKNNALTLKTNNLGSNGIAIAMQNDSYEMDFELIDLLLEAGINNTILYVHPSSSEKFISIVKDRYKKSQVETKDRFSNISYIFTRYSTLALEYQKNGIPAVFFLRDDDICISNIKKEHLNFCKTKDSLINIIKIIAQELKQ